MSNAIEKLDSVHIIIRYYNFKKSVKVTPTAKVTPVYGIGISAKTTFALLDITANFNDFHPRKTSVGKARLPRL